MNYELAKELMDAGFPQERQKVQSDIEGARAVVSNVKLPTTLELIEACGDELLSLNHIKDEGYDDGRLMWWAESKNHGRAGETIDESVAQLWLALNKQ